MDELPPSKILEVAYTIAGKLFPGAILEGEELVEVFQTTSIDVLHNKTGIAENVLTQFMNQTIPCMVNETVKASQNPSAGEQEAWNNIWVNCFYYMTSPTDSPITPAPVDCSLVDLNALIRSTMFQISILLLIIMSFCVQKRRRACLDCCYGFPGPVVPLNMLDSFTNRKGYTLAFGITANSIVSIIFGDNASLLGSALNYHFVEFTDSYPFFKVLIKIFMSVYVAMMSYPFFVTQNMKNKLVGSILGLLFSLYWLSFEIFKMYVLAATCFKSYREAGTEHQQMFYVFYEIPKYVCLFLMCIKFAYVLVMTVKKRQEKKARGLVVNWLYEDDWDWREEYMYIHVKEVLKKHTIKDEPEIENLPLKLKIKKKIRAMLYVYKPGFKYSTRFLVAMFVSLLAVYCAFMIIAGIGYWLFNILLEGALLESDMVNSVADALKVPLEDILDYGRAIGISFWLGMATSLILYFLVTMNQFTWYRRHVLMLRRGDRTFLPSGIRKKTLAAPALMNASFKYAGFQVGYSIWGFILSSQIFWIAWMIIVTQIFLPMVRKELSFLLILLIKQWPNIVVAIVIMVAQMIIARCCFIISDDTLAVDNRRTYHIFSYFMFYFNIFLGLVSCLIRILLGLVLGVIFMQRLAKSTLPRSYERRDPGYLAYVSFLMLEHQHANPVLQCFVRLLLETKEIQLKDEFSHNEREVKRSTTSTKSLICLDDNIANKAKSIRNISIRARNRWHLFVTMTMNPSIIKYRIRFMKVNKDQQFMEARLNIVYSNSTFTVAEEEKKKESSTLSEDKNLVEFPEVFETSNEIINGDGEIRYRFTGDVERNVEA